MALPIAIASWVVGLGVAAIVMWAFALFDLFGRWRALDKRQRSAWLLIIVLLPIIGSVLYLLQHRR
ncbi:MAG: PLDc N-terminal domain-containing protein [Actinomycetota bacterium]|nr:PLDc N-terminal domain-containing protein [Actinomycetota bacterium]